MEVVVDLPYHEEMNRCFAIAALAVTTILPGCTSWLFSAANLRPSGSRPVVRIETMKGVEYGAATDHGILFLGRTATEGACRVHYFLGSQVYTEDGTVTPAGGVFYRAEIDLKHQIAPLLGRDLTQDDTILALTMRGDDVYGNTMALARKPGIDGDVATWPGVHLPVGTPLFVSIDDELHFVGLVAGVATLEQESRRERFVVFSGPDRIREMLLVPQLDPKPRQAKHRADGITVLK